MVACVDHARAAGASRLYLESNLKQGRGARSLPGFRLPGSLPPERRPVSPYARANVWMELRL